MRIFIAVLVLIFSLQSWTKADDIRDFEIEGMSIGDSLLDYFTKNEINKFFNYDDLPSDMKFRITEIYSGQEMNMKNYNGMQLYYKPKDPKYIIYALSGVLDCKNKSDCNKIFNEVYGDLRKIYKSGKKETIIHPDDKSGKSIHTFYKFKLNEGFISVTKKLWSDAVKWTNSVNVMMAVNEVTEWIKNDWGTN